MSAPKVSVLILGFNRAQFFERVFTEVLSWRPPRVYISLDGPRQQNYEDESARNQILQIIEKADPTIPVMVNSLKENLGCKEGVVTGINWFFEHEEQGVILEDDCLPSTSFYQMSNYFLRRFQNREEVFSISGFRAFRSKPEDDRCLFSAYPQVWGWATWKRVWDRYDADITEWPSARKSKLLREMFPDRLLTRVFWKNRWDSIRRSEIDTWDYQLAFLFRRYGGLTLIPPVNLVENLGMGGDGTRRHNYRISATRRELDKRGNWQQVSLTQIRPDRELDLWMENKIFRVRLSAPYQSVVSRLKRLEKYWSRIFFPDGSPTRGRTRVVTSWFLQRWNRLDKFS